MNMELNFTNMVTLLATNTTPTPSAGAITYTAIFRVAPFHPQVFAFCLHVAALGVTVGHLGMTFGSPWPAKVCSGMLLGPHVARLGRLFDTLTPKVIFL